MADTSNTDPKWTEPAPFTDMLLNGRHFRVVKGEWVPVLTEDENPPLPGDSADD